MSLRQQLTRPLVVDPAGVHTHTVVFLHRFPQSTTDQELREKVLSGKLTRNHKSLGEQFPSVRWVFPYGKAHARPWNNLSPEDRLAVGMTIGSLPYITQVILHEAQRAGGLDRVIIGGQGETAEAAHEAISSFPEIKNSSYDNEDEVAAFIRKHFHTTRTDLESLKLAGFVGMHAQDGQLTRDVKNFGMMSKEAPGKQKINTTIIKNTPHRFIHGGYKLQTTTWDGKRIDDFADFLVSIGVGRHTDSDDKQVSNETLTPKERADPAVQRGRHIDAKDELSDMQKHALEVVRQKKADEALRDKVRRRIEADKVERKIRQERQRQNRLRGGATARPTGSVNLLGGGSHQPMPGAYPQQPPGSPDVDLPGVGSPNITSSYEESPESDWPDSSQLMGEDGVMRENYMIEAPRKRRARREQGRPVGGGEVWSPQSQVRGEMSESRIAAFGLTQVKDEVKVDVKDDVKVEDDDVAI